MGFSRLWRERRTARWWWVFDLVAHGGERRGFPVVVSGEGDERRERGTLDRSGREQEHESGFGVSK